MKSLFYSAFIILVAKSLYSFGVSDFISIPVLFFIISLEPKSTSNSAPSASLPVHPLAPTEQVSKEGKSTSLVVGLVAVVVALSLRTILGLWK